MIPLEGQEPAGKMAAICRCSLPTIPVTRPARGEPVEPSFRRRTLRQAQGERIILAVFPESGSLGTWEAFPDSGEAALFAT